jgi:hypothetical protein
VASSAIRRAPSQASSVVTSSRHVLIVTRGPVYSARRRLNPES